MAQLTDSFRFDLPAALARDAMGRSGVSQRAVVKEPGLDDVTLPRRELGHGAL
jgi:hypothetical protein